MGIHVSSHDYGCKNRLLTTYSGLPKLWPIALLSVLNSKYKIRLQMEQERDRASLLTLSLGMSLTMAETADL
jgi:hypothetical protein